MRAVADAVGFLISMQLPRQCPKDGRRRDREELMRLMNGRVGIAAVTGMAIALLLPPPAVAQSDDRALTDAYNASGLALFKQLSGPSGNIVFSPFSVGTAMAMVLSGARGETEREMASVLKQRLDRPAMEAANGALRSALNRYDKSAEPPKCPRGMQVAMQASGARCEGALPSDGQCQFPAERAGERCVASGSFPSSARLLTANALMLAGRGDLVAADYATLLKDKYGAEIFANAGLDDVNGWVKRKTEGKIERILEQLDRSTAAVILNAIYFKAKWAAVFNKAATMDDAFDLSLQKKISVPTMHRRGSFALVARPLYRAIRLPYDVGNIGMVIVLPNEIDGLGAVSRRLDDGEWAQLVTALQAPDAAKATDLAMPRFKTSFAAGLVPQFQQAGMKRAFDLKLADFSGMTGRPAREVPLAIGSIMHRAVIEVMEGGTEAAAATAVAVRAGAAAQPPEQPQLFHVDHPFLFAILDDASGAILFQGRIVDPR
jgi:serpin B